MQGRAGESSPALLCFRLGFDGLTARRVMAGGDVCGWRTGGGQWCSTGRGLTVGSGSEAFQELADAGAIEQAAAFDRSWFADAHGTNLAFLGEFIEVAATQPIEGFAVLVVREFRQCCDCRCLRFVVGVHWGSMLVQLRLLLFTHVHRSKPLFRMLSIEPL